MKYKSKPVEIDAWEIESLEGEHTRRLPPHWVFEAIQAQKVAVNDDGGLTIRTLEGTMQAKIGDFLILGTEGELYPCKPSVFKAKYELARQSLVGSELDK